MDNHKRINKKKLFKIEKFCSTQERCIFDIIKKLNSWEIKNNHNFIIEHLIKNNFLDEQRFSNTFSSGKFNIKKWGKIRISFELKKRNIKSTIIKNSLEEIDNEQYITTIRELINKKYIIINEKDVFKKKSKTVQYLYQKGYETSLVWKLLNEEIK
jgi:regulatory protein